MMIHVINILTIIHITGITTRHGIRCHPYPQPGIPKLKKKSLFLMLRTSPFTQLINYGHYHYRCISQIWELAIQCIITLTSLYGRRRVMYGGRLRNKTTIYPILRIGDYNEQKETAQINVGHYFISCPIFCSIHWYNKSACLLIKQEVDAIFCTTRRM